MEQFISGIGEQGESYKNVFFSEYGKKTKILVERTI